MQLDEESEEPDITVDRGQPVIITVRFADGDPDRDVNFSYMRPGSERPYLDDGFGQPKSKIKRLDEGVYQYTIDTDGFLGGLGHWHMWGEWERETLQRPYEKAHKRGTYRVRGAPSQTL